MTCWVCCFYALRKCAWRTHINGVFGFVWKSHFFNECTTMLYSFTRTTNAFLFGTCGVRHVVLTQGFLVLFLKLLLSPMVFSIDVYKLQSKIKITSSFCVFCLIMVWDCCVLCVVMVLLFFLTFLWCSLRFFKFLMILIVFALVLLVFHLFGWLSAVYLRRCPPRPPSHPFSTCNTSNTSTICNTSNAMQRRCKC